MRCPQAVAYAALTAGFVLAVAQAAPAAEVEVRAVAGNRFDPATVTIQEGDTVTWRNANVGGPPHNVRADDGSFRCAAGCDGGGGNGNPSSSGWSFSLTFNEAGDIPYHCEVHGAPRFGMAGTVIVEAADTDDGDGDPTAPCVEDDDTLCLLSQRFRIEVEFRAEAGGPLQAATAVPFSDRAGMFWFFNANNIEMLIKVLNACNLEGFNTYWVFFAATTDREFTVEVTDTVAGVVKEYSNPLGMAALPVTDTMAFATCDTP